MEAIRPYLKNKRHIIWDWNGTLLDDLALALAAIGRLLRENGLEAVSREAYVEIFGFPVIDYYRRLGFDFEKKPFAQLAEQFIAYYNEGFSGCSLHEGVLDFLEEAKKQSLTQSILSASQETALHAQLSRLGVVAHVDHVYGLTDHFAVSKVERGRQLMAKVGIPHAETLLIGDTDHDLEVGRELGVEVLLLGDGHQSYERLKNVHHAVLAHRA